MVSNLALKRLRLDRVWWLVSPQNPLKPLTDMAPFADRLGAARTVASHPRIMVSTLEAEIGTIYSVDTVKMLRKRFPRTRFVWIMGADNLRQMSAWQNWPSLFRTVGVAVFDRPGYALKALSGCAAGRFAGFRLPERRGRAVASRRPPTWVFHHTRLDLVSATAIRNRKPGSRSALSNRECGAPGYSGRSNLVLPA